MTPGANLNDWQHAWETAQPRLSALRDTFLSSKSPNSRVLRVGQLDAELLDQELVTILKEPLERALSLVNVMSGVPVFLVAHTEHCLR
jgi:peroxin-2